MDKLHKTIWRLEFLLAIILFLIAIAGILDAGIPKRIILNVNIEVIGVSLIVSYLVFFIGSLIRKNIFWYRFKKQNNLISIPNWLFFIIPLTTIFLPKIFLFAEIIQNRKEKLPVYLISQGLFLLGVFFLLVSSQDWVITDTLIDKFELIFGNWIAFPIFIFAILIISHCLYGHLLKTIKFDNSNILNEIETIGGNPDSKEIIQ